MHSKIYRCRGNRKTDSKNIEILKGNIGEEFEDMESKWIKLESKPIKISIGVFYGPLENEKLE